MDQELFDRLSSDEVQELIAKWRHKPQDKLLFNPPQIISGIQKEVVDQIISLRKAETKLDHFRRFFTILPPPLSMEQCSSYLTAAYKAQLVSGESICDLTGGAGVDSLAFCEKFKQVHYIENNSYLSNLFDFNARKSAVKNLTVHEKSAEEYLNSSTNDEVFYIDPARRDDLQRKVAGFEDCSPNLLEIWDLLIKKFNSGIVKASPMLDIKKGLEQLSHISQVHVVSIKDEVKEVLFVMKNDHVAEPEIIVSELVYPWDTFTFRFSSERDFDAPTSKTQNYLYEPSSGLLKSGAYNTICRDTSLKKISVNTHLYTSENLESNFRGKTFEVIKNDVSKKEIGKYAKNGDAHIITRNYPSSTDILRKKFKLKEKGDLYLVGYRDHHNKPLLTLAKRLS